MSNPETFDQSFFDAQVDSIIERVDSIDREVQEAEARLEAWPPPKDSEPTETIEERLANLRTKLTSQKKRSFWGEVHYDEFYDDGEWGMHVSEYLDDDCDASDNWQDS